MTKKNKKTLYYAEIRICGFDNKQELIAAVEDAIEQIRPLTAAQTLQVARGDVNIEVEFAKLGYANAGADWLPMKTPKKIRKVIGEA